MKRKYRIDIDMIENDEIVNNEVYDCEIVAPPKLVIALKNAQRAEISARANIERYFSAKLHDLALEQCEKHDEYDTEYSVEEIDDEND